MGGFLRVAAVAAAAVVSSGLVTGTGHAAAVVVNDLYVRIYDNTGVTPQQRARALARAGEILARVEIDTAWLECPAHGTGTWRSACDAPPAPGELVVRLVHASPQADRSYPRALGYSLVDIHSGEGTLATVFINRIEALAGKARADRSLVLGRAIAHEIGHLLLGSNAHGGSGLMREIWTFDEIRRDRAEDWQFTRTEREGLLASRVLGTGMLASGRGRTGGAGTAGQDPHSLLNRQQ
jgi:hypothetical protein